MTSGGSVPGKCRTATSLRAQVGLGWSCWGPRPVVLVQEGTAKARHAVCLRFGPYPRGMRESLASPIAGAIATSSMSPGVQGPLVSAHAWVVALLRLHATLCVCAEALGGRGQEGSSELGLQRSMAEVRVPRASHSPFLHIDRGSPLAPHQSWVSNYPVSLLSVLHELHYLLDES